MDFSEEVHENIEKHIEKRLKGDALRQFETLLKNDPNLKKELAFQREMKGFLANTKENALRKSLMLLNEEVDEDSEDFDVDASGGNSIWRYLLFAVPLLLLAGWWFLSGEKPTPPTTEITSITETKKNIPEEVIIKDTITSPPAVVEETPKVAPKQKPEPPAKKKKSNTKKKEKTAPPVKKDPFATNPDMELLTMENSIPGMVSFSTGTIPGNANEIKYQFNTNFKLPEKDLTGQTFKLHFFTNDKNQFEEFKPFITEDLILKNAGNGNYKVDFESRLSVKPGLYYYLFRDPQNTDLYSIGSFKIDKM